MRGHILILTANVLFGISMPVFKYLLSSDVPPEAITIMRASFACVMFWLTSLFMPSEKVAGKDMAILFVCAMCGVGINQYLFVLGLKSSSPVDASIIATFVPITVMLLAALILKEPITSKKATGVMIGVGGGLLLVFSSNHGDTGNGSLYGDMLMLINQLMYSLYLVLLRPLSSRYSSVTNMKWMFLFSTIALMPFCVGALAEVPTFHKATFSWAQAGALFYLLFFVTYLAFMLITMSLKVLRPTVVSMYNYVQPVVASAIAIAIGQDTFSITKLVSLLLVFVGVYLVTTSRSKLKPTTIKN